MNGASTNSRPWLGAVVGGLLGVAGALPAQAEEMPSDEQKFLEDAMEASVAEIELGKIAEERSDDEDVDAFAARMIRDHSDALADAKAIHAPGVKIPQEPSPEHRQLAESLSQKSGADFDRGYMEAMVEDHETSIEKFERAAGKETDSAVVEYAQKTLPILEEHLEMAEAIREDLE